MRMNPGGNLCPVAFLRGKRSLAVLSLLIYPVTLNKPNYFLRK